MIVQALDIKDNCKGVFFDGHLMTNDYQQKISEAKYAWKYSGIFEGMSHDFLYILTRGAPLEEFSKEKQQFREVKQILEAHQRASVTAKVEMSENCFYDLLPAGLLSRYFLLRERAMINLLENRNFAEDKQILHKAHILTSRLSRRQILVNSVPRQISYNIFGTKTGRFTNSRTSVPILTMKRDDRGGLSPKNSVFLELDYNAAELRTLLALQGTAQPEEDLHFWNMKNIYSSKMTRDEAKRKIFAWLYNSKLHDKQIEGIYNREHVQSQFWSSGYISTPFGRKIEVERKNSLNYLLQSTTNDIVIENALKISEALKGKRSFVCFTMHDSVVLDFCRSETKLLKDIKGLFMNNRLGRYPCNIAIGKNYGAMRKVKI
tara:strand:+ start:3786 stop:4913 length:1128 start_codon:yes stop_codon:yes gene_type:complete